MRSTLLLVDEEPANLSSFVNKLQTRGYEVLLSDCGKQAVEVAAQTVPDLILLDAEMSNADGYETCRAIKANAASASIPVIFLTTLLNQEACFEGFAAGGVDYFTKPLDVTGVVTRIKLHLELVSGQQRLALANERLEKAVEVRTAELETTHLALQAQIEQNRQQQLEKNQLLAMLNEQNQQLAQLTDWLVQSHSKAKLELGQMINQQLLDNLALIEGDMKAVSTRLKSLGETDEAISSHMFSMRLRHNRLLAYLQKIEPSGRFADNTSTQTEETLPTRLTERERKVLTLLCDGLTSRAIGQQLGISEVTVRTYRTNLMKKLQIDHLPGLVKFALRHNLTSLD
ncbi:MAG: response regulator [Chloroflexota bacterium]